MKKTLVIILILTLSGMVWYLFIKEYDYQFQMKAKYGPGTVYQEISDWNRFSADSQNDNIQIISAEPFKFLKQKIFAVKDKPVEFLWEFKRNNDSITDLILHVKSEKNQLANRLDIINPFQESRYIDTLKKSLLAFKQKLDEHQNTYAVKIVDSLVNSPARDCICYVSKEIPVKRKASEMVNSITFLEDYVLSRDLKLTGNPFVKVKKWDRKREIIDFEFCFPVNLAQDIRPAGEIEFRQLKSFSALKAIYNGNYRSTHLAWNDLLFEAEEKNLNTNELPLEIFFNNPKVEGSAAKTWKADIYLPVLE